MKSITLLLFLSFAILTNGQNLVPNPSFEEYFTCPLSAGGLGINGGDPWIKDWYSMQWTPDYMHYCAGPGASNYPTDNAWGYQEPYDGDGYVSIIVKYQNLTAREYIAVELLNPLESGETYEVSFYVSDADGGFEEVLDCIANNVGLRFLKNPPYYWNNENDNFPLLPTNEADINYYELLSDSIGWTLIEGVFVADDTYTHIAIGNFFDNDNTIIVESGVDEGCFAAYYIDMVCVIKSGDICELPFAIREYEFRDIVFQNIVNDELDLSNVEEYTIDKIQVFDVSGKLAINNNLNDGKVDVSTLSKGLYLLQVKFNDGLINNYKFIKE